VRHIRPYRLFTMVPGDRMLHVPIPARPGLGGVSLLETFLLLSAAKIVSARRVFEFGTFLGTTTLNFALNLPEDASIYTLDLDAEARRGLMQDVADAPLTDIHLTSRPDFSGKEVAHKITTLTGNSISFDFSPWVRSVDMVFIDGGHDLVTVRSDSENAFAMARESGPACVAWHDYGNPEYPDLTQYLDSLPEELLHVEDSMLCLWFRNVAPVEG